MRCIKLTTLAALPIAVSLTLGAAQQDARAGACAKAGKNPGCVTSKDVKNNSLKGGKGGTSRTSPVRISSGETLSWNRFLPRAESMRNSP